MEHNLSQEDLKKKNKKQSLGCLVTFTIIALLAVLTYKGALSQSFSGFLLMLLLLGPMCFIVFIIQLIRKKDFAPWFIGLFIFLALGLIGSWGVNKVSTTDRPLTDINRLESVKRAEQEKEDTLIAYVMAQDFVSSQLKSPSTAKFQNYSKELVQNLGDGRYRVSAYVDAQNPFGAMVRNQFNCIVKYVGNEKWVLENIEMK